MAELSLGRRVDGLRTSGPVRSVTEGGVGGDWITLLLHILVMATTASSILRVEEGARSSVLVPLAVGGLVSGFVLARTPALDAISHLLALFVGVVAALAATAARADGAAVVWNSHGRALYDLAERIVLAQVDREPRRLPDGDLIAIIGVTIWLVGYSSGWMLYRRRWLLPALVVPATLVFVSLRFEDAEPSGALAVFALASLIMAARHNAFTRQLDWTRRRLPAPRGLPGRFTVSGIVIAAFALAAGWALPYQGPHSIVDDFGGKADRLWSWVQDRSEDVGLWPGGDVGSSGFNDFTDSFTIGEQFNPSPDPVATFDGEPGTYLAVRRWDFYSGHGWKSDVDAQFRMEGEDEDVRVTDVTFEPSGTVVLSPSVGSLRRVNTGEVTVLKGQGGLLYTTDTYIRAGIPVFTVMGWLHFDDEAIDIESVPIETVHIQLQDLVRKLRGATFVRDPDTGLPRIEDPDIAAEIELARAQLRQLPVEFSFAYGPDGQVLLLLNGRLPNYDDIEAVYANVDDQEQPPVRYEVNGSESVASEDELRAAGTDDPSWVTERYLQLPDSTTDETRALAAQVVDEAGATTVFDQAWAIQQFLRDETQFTYELNSDQAQSNRDLVDFFLFGKKQGRCEEFATAMVVMLRSIGVPTRLVGGYRASEELTERGEFLYREEQAHTWVEVFFPGYGWIPFEPTPSVADPFDYPGESDAQQQPDQLPDQNPEPTPTPESTPEPTPEATPGFAAPPTDGANSDGGGLLSNTLGLATLGLTAVAAAIFGGLTLAWIWGLRGLRPGAALYTRAIRVGRLFGIEPHPTMTPREYAVEFGRTVPRAGRAVAVVADIYSAERYGGIEITEDAKRGGDWAWHDVRAAALRWRPWRKRLKR